MTPSEAATTGPVTVTFIRRVTPGRERDYEQALAALHAEAHGTLGYLGVNVVHEPGTREYASIVRFDSLANLREWEARRVRERWQEDRLAGIVEGPAEERRAGGIEFWFESPKHAVRAPSPHKMALVLVVVVWCIGTAIALSVGPQLAGLAPPLRILISACVQVALMTYVVMPRVTRLLSTWLFPG